MTSRRNSPTTIAVAGVATATLACISLATLVVVQLSGSENPAHAVTDPTIAPSTSPEARRTTPPLGGTGEPPLGTVERIQDSRPVPMPLDPYLAPMSEIKLIDQARDIGAAACMRSLGFTEWTETTIRTWKPEDYREHDFFEYLDPKYAAEKGYPKPVVIKSDSSPSADAKHEPTAEERKAFDGAASRTTSGVPIPAGGCAHDAELKIYGSNLGQLPADSRELAIASRSRALGDSRVREALTAWRSCMQNAGITAYQHPVTSKNDPRWQSRALGTLASAEERRVASIDAKCQAEVNLVGIYKTARVAYENRLLKEYKTKLEESKLIFRSWAGNARAIIKSSQPSG